jgi:hypothetical protein
MPQTRDENQQFFFNILSWVFPGFIHFIQQRKVAPLRTMKVHKGIIVLATYLAHVF